MQSKPIKMWVVFDNYATCHITVPVAPYLSTDVRYTIDEYRRIMSRAHKKQTKGKKSLNYQA